MLHRIIRCRRLRAQLFGENLFADPAWDMLLDLAVARAQAKQVSVMALCHASGVPSTTALRWIRLLEEAGLVLREDDARDRRRSNIRLSSHAEVAMETYLNAVSQANPAR